MKLYFIGLIFFLCPPTHGGEELELKIAKLWNLVDDLDNRLKKQEEEINILKKGMMLGLIPDEFLKDSPIKWEKQEEEKIKPLKESMNSNQLAVDSSAQLGIRQGTPEEYKKLVKKAQEMFSKRNYGQAITIYQEIERTQKNQNSEGQTSFWIGLSWYYLKEYDLAEESFLKLLESHNKSPWAPKSYFYRGKILSERGEYRKAVKEFRSIIRLYPNTDASDMAALEIQRIQERI